MAEMEFETGYNKGRNRSEIEYVSVTDMDTKTVVEKALLGNRISYFIKWGRTHFFSSREQAMTFIINLSQLELADQTMEALDDNVKSKIRFLHKKSERKK
ncbi:MAG: hypothetical protein K5682_00435 [Lachnospiraceae bacterium]|nr:hypothetical protein [Lachnospiraceae bacterium]